MSSDIVRTTEKLGICYWQRLYVSAKVDYHRDLKHGQKYGQAVGRGLNRLSAVKVARLKTPGYYADGGCLYLRVAPGGTKGWIFRFAMAGRSRDAGLGSFPEISLVKAREEAECRRRLVAAGVDPIDAKRKEREADLLAASKAMSFEQCAKAFIAAHEISWKNDKHKDQWRSTLATYCYPVIGSLPVQSIDTSLVLKVLEPIWNKNLKQHPECASASSGY